MDSRQEQQQAERGERTAENVRYEQTISEGGMGGKTTEAGGVQIRVVSSGDVLNLKVKHHES